MTACCAMASACCPTLTLRLLLRCVDNPCAASRGCFSLANFFSLFPASSNPNRCSAHHHRRRLQSTYMALILRRDSKPSCRCRLWPTPWPACAITLSTLSAIPLVGSLHLRCSCALLLIFRILTLFRPCCPADQSGGNRPLCIGKLVNTKRPVWVISSETCAFFPIGAELVREVSPVTAKHQVENLSRSLTQVGLIPLIL